MGRHKSPRRWTPERVRAVRAGRDTAPPSPPPTSALDSILFVPSGKLKPRPLRCSQCGFEPHPGPVEIAVLGDIADLPEDTSPMAASRRELAVSLARSVDRSMEPAGALLRELRGLMAELRASGKPDEYRETGGRGDRAAADEDWSDLGVPT